MSLMFASEETWNSFLVARAASLISAGARRPFFPDLLVEPDDFPDEDFPDVPEQAPFECLRVVVPLGIESLLLTCG